MIHKYILASVYLDFEHIVTEYDKKSIGFNKHLEE